MSPTSLFALTLQTFLAALHSVEATGRMGDTKAGCQTPFVRYNGTGFYSFEENLISSEADSAFDIKMEVTTKSDNGLLLWKQSEENKDYIALGIKDGEIMFEYFYSKQNKTITLITENEYNKPIAQYDGTPFTIRAVKLIGGKGWLMVEGRNLKTWRSTGPATRGNASFHDNLNTEGAPLYLGGLPSNMSINTTTLGLFPSGFQGCISYLSIEKMGKVSPPSGYNTEERPNFYRTLALDYSDITCPKSCETSGSMTYIAGVFLLAVSLATATLDL